MTDFFSITSAPMPQRQFCHAHQGHSEEETVSRLQDFFERLSHLQEDETYKIFYRCGLVPMQKAMLLGNRVADAGKTTP